MSEPGAVCRRTVHFAGTVQGVGFRYTTQRIAHGYQVTGYVRNLPDGRVELVAEGRADEVERFLRAVEKAMAGFIHHRQVAEGPPTGEFVGFQIRR